MFFFVILEGITELEDGVREGSLQQSSQRLRRKLYTLQQRKANIHNYNTSYYNSFPVKYNYAPLSIIMRTSSYHCIKNFEIQILQLHEGKHIHKYGIRDANRRGVVIVSTYLQPLQG
jgi:hypothetical protein